MSVYGPKKQATGEIKDAGTLILSWTSSLQNSEKHISVVQITQYVVFCYGNLSRLIHKPLSKVAI